MGSLADVQLTQALGVRGESAAFRMGPGTARPPGLPGRVGLRGGGVGRSPESSGPEVRGARRLGEARVHAGSGAAWQTP